MPCNYTGLYDYDAYPELAKFGLVDYDCALLPPRAVGARVGLGARC